MTSGTGTIADPPRLRRALEPPSSAPVPHRRHALEAGIFLIAVGAPLAFIPQTRTPFLDVKLVLLAGGALLVCLSGVRADRRLLGVAALWVGALAASSLAGVDPWLSLLGAHNQGTGLVTLGVSAYLLSMGPRLGPSIIARLRRWLVGVGAAMAAIAVAAYVAPLLTEAVTGGLSLRTATMGNPVFLAGFLSVSTVAALDADARQARLVALLALLASGFAVTGERSAFISPVVALLAVYVFLPGRRRHLLRAIATFAVVLAVWTVIPQPGASGSSASQTTRQFQTLLGERQRLAIATADLRASTDRPLLGWGPGNTWSAYVSAASEDEMRTAGRGWGDGHNIFVEMLVTTGLLGLGILIVLVAKTARAARGAVSDRRWTLAAAAALGVLHLYEPLNVVLTPLLFLLAGIAVGGPRGAKDGSPREAVSGRRWPHAAAAVLLSAVVILATTNLAASALEQWGRTHFAEWSLRASLTLQPWRISAGESLALARAVDGRSGDEEAEREARAIIGGVVARHPWSPTSRLIAAGVEMVLNEPKRAQAWLQEHRWRFPNDILDEPSGAASPPSVPDPW